LNDCGVEKLQQQTKKKKNVQTKMILQKGNVQR